MASLLPPLRKMPQAVIASDSEESEAEGGVESCRNRRYPRVIMDLMYEMEVREYYSKLLESRKASRVAIRSKACQTNPDIATIPPSWILLGEKLACELRTGLGNIINRIHDDSEEYCKGRKRQKPDSGRMQYFRYINGHLESRLLPGVKIPESALPGNYMDYSKELEILLEKACKLSIIMPCISEVTQTYLKQIQENEAFLTKMLKEAESKITGSNANYNLTQGVPCCSHMKFVSSLEELPEISDEDSIMPGCSSNMDFKASTKPKFQSSRHGKYAAGTLQNADVSPRKIMNGTAVPKHRPRVLFSSDNNRDPSSSRQPNNERKPLASNVRMDEHCSNRLTKRTGNGQENLAQAQSSKPKNFIKRNIMAVKTAVVTRSGKVYRGL